MIVLMFILIAFVLRKRYLPEDSPWTLKFLYYGCFAVLTPIVGILIFRKIDWDAPGDFSGGGWVFPNIG